MSNYLKNRMLNILEQASSSENFYNEGCKSEGCKDEGCGTEGCGTEGCGTEGCSGRYKDEGCDANTNASLYDGNFVDDEDYDDDEDEDDDEDFDVYEDDDDCIEDCDECAVSLNYSVETIPVFAQDGEYYVEYSMLRKYMDCNNIDTVAEAVSDVCNYNKISKEDISVVVETARKRRKKKVSKSKARKIRFAKSDLSNAINRGITVKTSKKRKKKRKR